LGLFFQLKPSALPLAAFSLPNILYAAFAAIALRDRRKLVLEVSEEGKFLVEVELSANFGLNEIIGGAWTSNIGV